MIIKIMADYFKIERTHNKLGQYGKSKENQIHLWLFKHIKMFRVNTNK